ncbi:hypothetical protein ABW20_dc0102081 [Dactylellina cionopaga]|nr:hypothetical protein ABW20_dc0102081 [Dactylellina cionopaga]
MSANQWTVISVGIQTPVADQSGEACGQGLTCPYTGVASQCGAWLGYENTCCAVAITRTDTPEDINIPCTYITGIQTSSISNVGSAAYNQSGPGCPNNDVPLDFYAGSETTLCCKSSETIFFSNSDTGFIQILGCGDWTLSPSAQDIDNGEGKGGMVVPSGGGTSETVTKGPSSSSSTASVEGPSSTPINSAATSSTPMSSSTAGAVPNPTETAPISGGATTIVSSGGKSTATSSAAKTNLKISSLVLGSAFLVMFINAQL